MKGPEQHPSEYLRQAGVPIFLEQMLAAVVLAKPNDPKSYMIQFLSRYAALPPVRERLTETDVEEKRERVASIFRGISVGMVSGIRYAPFRLTDFAPPLPPLCIEDIADSLAFLNPFADCDVIVAPAARAAGAVAHAISLRIGKPYSLCNWYPEGCSGDIIVHDSSEGFGANKGKVFLNSIERGMRVAFLDDVLRTGDTAYGTMVAVRKHGALPVAAVFVGEAVDFEGRKGLLDEFANLEVFSLVRFHLDGKRTRLEGEEPCAEAVPDSYPVSEVPFSQQSRRLPRTPNDLLQGKLDTTQRSFVGIPIQKTAKGYPYSNFCLTDFVPLMEPSLVEVIADCCVALAPFDDADVIVSESDRGGGPLTHAIAVRTGQPYCLANWYSTGTEASEGVRTFVGYSGAEGEIFVNGVVPGTKVIVVDDMLSSGGTCEALCKCIVRRGGILVGAVFASEKVNLKGRDRLRKNFPDLKIFSMCFFRAEGTVTTAAD